VILTHDEALGVRGKKLLMTERARMEYAPVTLLNKVILILYSKDFSALVTRFSDERSRVLSSEPFLIPRPVYLTTTLVPVDTTARLYPPPLYVFTRSARRILSGPLPLPRVGAAFGYTCTRPPEDLAAQWVEIIYNLPCSYKQTVIQFFFFFFAVVIRVAGNAVQRTRGGARTRG
jgi:hypothetical protein